MKFKPWNYQEYAIIHVMDHNAAGLFLDMGMGKTVSSLTAIDNLLFLGDTNKVLIIAPKRVAEDTWSTEVEKWDHLKDLRISIILGTPKQRGEAVKKDADIYVTSRDNVVWLVENYFKTWKWGTCFSLFNTRYTPMALRKWMGRLWLSFLSQKKWQCI